MKERLTGAIILVVLLVVLVPELLTGPGPSAPAKSNAAEGAPLRSYTIDLAEGAGTRAAGPAAPTSEPASAALEEPVEQTAEPETEGAGDGTSTVDAETTPPVVADSGASSTDAPVAAESSAPPMEPGTPPELPQTREAEKPSAGTGATAVEQPRSAFGPSAAPAAANEARPGGQAAVPSVPAARTAARVAPPATGWMIQLGVFAKRDNAERLAKQVKGKGFTVVVDRTSSGKRLYRVRVGPESDRAAAVALRAKLGAAGYPGSLVAYP